MKNAQELSNRLNEIINDYYARQTIRLSGPRYFPKDYVTPEPFEDRETLVQLHELVEELSKGRKLDKWKVKTRDEK